MQREGKSTHGGNWGRRRLPNPRFFLGEIPESIQELKEGKKWDPKLVGYGLRGGGGLVFLGLNGKA